MLNMLLMNNFLKISVPEDSYINRYKPKFEIPRSPEGEKEKKGGDMEYFFEFDTQEELPWFDIALEANQSAFVKYRYQPRQGFGLANRGNVNKRMVEFLRKSWAPMIGSVEAEKERNHKHMINERMRREKEKQGYIELHNLLPDGTKSDKNSIVQMARKTIEDLQRQKEELQRKNYEFEMAIAESATVDAQNYKKMEEAKIKLKVAYPASGIDSMLEVLKCLKSADSIAKVICSKFSAQEFSAVLQIETKIAAAEVEKAVKKTLFEVERKFRCSFPEEE